jgi:hypothetical protein
VRADFPAGGGCGRRSASSSREGKEEGGSEKNAPLHRRPIQQPLNPLDLRFTDSTTSLQPGRVVPPHQPPSMES